MDLPDGRDYFSTRSLRQFIAKSQSDGAQSGLDVQGRSCPADFFGAGHCSFGIYRLLWAIGMANNGAVSPMAHQALNTSFGKRVTPPGKL